ncbi:MAG: hypothetical protein V4556_07630 [Bacteroidota bacterium]
MANENQEIASYDFLKEERVEKHFADINILLLSGKHIDQKMYTIFSLSEEFESHWRNFYKNLYNLNFESANFDGKKYFYLDFFDTAKGRFSDNSRHRELTEIQILIGLTLLDIYYKRFFDEKKVLKWSDITNLIIEGEQQQAYKRIFFNSVRQSNTYDEKDWKMVERKITSVIDAFDKLGWVEKLSSQNEELVFEIRPAINRLAKLYEEELTQFEDFVANLKKDDEI